MVCLIVGTINGGMVVIYGWTKRWIECMEKVEREGREVVLREDGWIK